MLLADPMSGAKLVHFPSNRLAGVDDLGVRRVGDIDKADLIVFLVVNAADYDSVLFNYRRRESVKFHARAGEIIQVTLGDSGVPQHSER
jgi:hypothetical protein